MMREIGFFMSLAPLLVNGHGSAHGSSASFSELITAKSVVAAVYFIVLFACTLVPTLRCTRSKFVKPILYGQVFGAGVFLATSLVHLLPAAQSSIKLVAPEKNSVWHRLLDLARQLENQDDPAVMKRLAKMASVG